MKNAFKFFCFFGVMLTLSSCAHAMIQGREPEDPLQHLNYRRAFDQSTIHKKHKPLMVAVECTKNVRQTSTALTQIVPSQDDLQEDVSVYGSYDLMVDHNSEKVVDLDLNSLALNDLPEWAAYKKDCLAQLRNARRAAILEPARRAVTTMFIMGGLVTLAARFLGTESVGGSIAISAAIFNSTFFIYDITSSVLNLLSTPTHPLDELEEQFAVNQCFIPRDLWPSLITNFMTARQNPFAQQNSMEFIKFTLGLTTYYPKPTVSLERDSQETLDTLSARTDKFFEDYGDFANEDEYGTLKVNILKFVLSLLKKNTLSRYLYLQGPGGIGKTHFTQQLCKWLNDITKNAIHVENLVITSPDELEGNEKKPGAFLRVLRNQCVAKKVGSVVFMDEASWLNRDIMTSPAKRVFNGQLSQISSTYFGTGLEGTGVHLEIPPILVILAGNTSINDAPLRSRFDIINFPFPKNEALVAYGEKLFGIHIGKLTKSKTTAMSHDIANRLKECTTFRDVEALVPASISKSLFPIRKKKGAKIDKVMEEKKTFEEKKGN